MTENVGLNSFFKKVLSLSQTQQLDTDVDGQISSQKHEAGLLTFGNKLNSLDTVILSATTESPSKPVVYSQPVPIAHVSEAPAVEETPEITNPSDKPVTAKNATQARKLFNEAKDAFIENYLKSNSELSNADKKSLIYFLNTKSSAFIEQYFKKNPQGPYNMSEIETAYTTLIKQQLQQRNELSNSMNEKIENYKGTNYADLTGAVSNAGEYVGSTEYEQIKEKAVAYLMGQLLSGEQDTDFLAALNPKYQTNSKYKAATEAITALKTETDPAKIKELMAKAETALSEFIGGQDDYGDSAIQKAITKKNTKLEKEQHSSSIKNISDEMIENYSNSSNVTQKDVDTYNARMGNIQTAFLAQYKGDGTNIENEFKAYVEKVNKELWNVESAIKDYFPTTVRSSFNTKRTKPPEKGTMEQLTATCETGKNASPQERAKVEAAAADYVIGQLLAGKSDITLLSNIASNYQNNPKFAEAKKLIDGCKSSATPKADFEKAQKLVNEMMAEMSAVKIKQAVNKEEAKNVKLSGNSSIGEALHGYNNNDTYGNDDLVRTEYTIQNGKLVWTHNKDAADLNKTFSQLEERIKTKMKAQLGDQYNEADIVKYLEQAKIAAMMEMSNPRDLHRVAEVVNNVITKFDKIATAGLHEVKTVASVKSNFGDTSITDDIEGFFGSDDKVNYKGWTQNSNGHVTLANSDNSDYQNTMNELYNRMLNKYKTEMGDKLDESAFKKMFQTAQANALRVCSNNWELAQGGSCKGDKHKNKLSLIMNQTLYEMDKILQQQI